MEELKRYRNSFILLLLLSVAGIMIGVYLYEYTDFFNSLSEKTGAVLVTEFQLEELVLLFFDEMLLPFMIFISGFTLFAPYLSAILLIYKGFLTGFSALYFGICYLDRIIDKTSFILISAVLVLILAVYITAGAKAIAFSASLRYAAPELTALLKRKNTGKYIITFLLLSCFLLVAVTIKYMIPIL